MASKLDGTHHQRAKLRYKLFKPAEMKASNATKRVHLLNLSAGGALVYSASPPEPGTVLRLQLDEHQRSARVVWTDGSRFGVAFNQPFADDQVEQAIAAQDALVAAASRRIHATAVASA